MTAWQSICNEFNANEQTSTRTIHQHQVTIVNFIALLKVLLLLLLCDVNGFSLHVLCITAFVEENRNKCKKVSYRSQKREVKRKETGGGSENKDTEQLDE